MTWLAYFLIVIQLNWVVSGVGISVIKAYFVYPLEDQTQFIHYATINRPDAVRKVYITPAALKAIRRGGSLPTDTQIVMEVYKAGQLQPILSVRQKGDAGLAALAQPVTATLRNGDWHSLEVPIAQPTTTKVDSPTCLACHSAAQAQDYVFTLPQMVAFAKTGVVQQVRCNRLGRRPCWP